MNKDSFTETVNPFASDKASIIPPPDYPSNSGIQPQSQNREFVFRHAGFRYKVFPSEESMRIYEDAKEYAKKAEKLDRKAKKTKNPQKQAKILAEAGQNQVCFSRAKAFQNMSIGLPLLTTERGSSIYSNIKICDCMSTPNEPNKLYDIDDDRQIAQVHMQRRSGYHSLVMQFKDEEIVIILHLRMNIADFKIGNDRFRFFKALKEAEGKPRKVPFLYKLYLLSPDQPSLVDEMDSSQMISEMNPLLESSRGKIFGVTPSSDERATYTSPHQCGCLEGVINKNKRRGTLSVNTPISGNPDSNDSVDSKSFIFVAVSLVLQEHEAELRRRKQRVHAAM